MIMGMIMDMDMDMDMMDTKMVLNLAVIMTTIIERKWFLKM